MLVANPNAHAKGRRRRMLMAAFGLVVALVALAAQSSCGAEDGSTFVDGSPCASVFKGLCGQPCTLDENCPDGLHCGADGKCTATCSPNGNECTQGTICSTRGRCLAPGGFGDSAPPPLDGSGGDACIDLLVDLAKVIPTVVLLVDQSSSMTTNFGGVTRWNAVRDALMDPDGGIVKSLQSDVVFGIALYTRDGPFPQDASTCPRLPTVAPAINNYGPINTFYQPENPIGGTPTGQSIDKLIGRRGGVIIDGGGFATLPTQGPKVIVLATDGEPDTCENGNDEVTGRQLSLGAAQAAFNAGVRTYIIAVGNQIGAQHLKEMANAGTGQSLDAGDASPFATSNRQEFVNAMNAIIFGVRSCVFTLAGQVQPGQEGTGSVTLDGVPLALNDPNGWRLNNPSELEVLGSACTKIKTTSGKLAVKFPCGAFEPK